MEGEPHIEEEALPLCVFPVACDQDEGTVFIINEPNAGNTDFKGSSSRTISIKGESVSVPRKYGTEPFMYLWGLIEETFKLCGYTVTYNVFKESSPLKDIVVLHNAVDTNIYGYSNNAVEYSMIVPDITVGELIGWLRDKFGAVVCAEDGEVSIRLFKDLVALPYDMDLSAYAREDLSVSYEPSKRLVISVDTDIDSAAPAAESLEDLIAAYSSRAEVDNFDQMVGEGLFYHLPLGKYYHKADSSSSPELVGSSAYKYSRIIQDIDTEDLASDDLFVPMILYNGKYYPYIGDSARRKFMDAGDYDEKYSQKLLICYAPYNQTKGRYAGTTTGCDEDGNAINGYPALIPEEIYKAYWINYQNILLNANPEISCQMDIPINVLLSLDIATPKRLNGDLVLIKEIKFNLSDTGVTVCDVVLQQIAQYEDAIEIPNVQITGELQWSYVNTKDPNIYTHGTTADGIQILETDGLTNYTSGDAPTALPSRPGVVTMKRERWIRYKKYESYHSFLSWGHSESTLTHRYTEYFISIFNG